MVHLKTMDDKQHLELGPQIWQSLCLSASIAGFGCAIYSLASSRVPMVMAFLPIGFVTRTDNAALFWIYIVLFLAVGVAGLAGFFVVRRRAAARSQNSD